MSPAFIECSQESCPSAVRSACVEWLHDVEARRPSVVIAIVAADGRDITEVSIEVEGAAVEQGTTVQVDPGFHRLRVHAPGYEDTSMSFVAREGEKRRPLRVQLDALREHVGHKSERPGEVITPVTWVTGGLAVLAFGSFAYFGLTGRSRASDLRATCAPACAESDRSAVKTRYLVADLSLVAGLLLGGVSVWSFLSTRHTEERSPR
jgi:hypothetical protein